LRIGVFGGLNFSPKFWFVLNGEINPSLIITIVFFRDKEPRIITHLLKRTISCFKQLPQVHPQKNGFLVKDDMVTQGG